MTTITTDKRVEKFRAMADGLQKRIDNAMMPMTQNATPKRMREYRSRLHDGENMERTQRALRAMASAIEDGRLPFVLEGVTTKDQVASLVRKSLRSISYYEVASDPRYADKTEAGRALQALMDERRSNADRIVDGLREREKRIRDAEDRVRFCDIPGFFPTPAETAERMVSMAGIGAGHTVLEPSAGIGSLAEAVQRMAPYATIQCVERNHSLREVLTAKGFALVGDDFDEFPAEPAYDRIVANPPFENGADARHVRRMYDCLKTGGRLVSIISAGPLFRQDARSEEFRLWLAGVQSELYDLPEGWCNGAAAFRSTAVKAHILTIDKEYN